jgi:hypothetical protein
MGSARPRYSIRAGKARSAKSFPRSRRKPVSSDLSKPRSAADSPLRDKRKASAALGTAAAATLREARDGVGATALRGIRRKLDIASAVAYVCAAALRAQAADGDVDVALCLQRCVGDALFEQTQHIDQLLGEDGNEDLRDGGQP